MKSKTINVRLDKWIDEQLAIISEKTGETKSSVLRASLIHLMTSKLDRINVIQHSSKNTYKKVDSFAKDKVLQVRVTPDEYRVILNCADHDNITLSEYLRKIISLYTYSSADEYIDEPNIISRKKKKRSACERLSDFIRDNAKLLTNEVAKEHMFDEDSFQDTILLFITDPEASKIFGSGKLVAHFKYRYNMLLYRNTMSERERRGHANDQQTKEDREEE